MLVSHRPTEPLASHVEIMWCYDGHATTSGQETVLPRGKFQLVVDLSSGEGTVWGVRTRHSVIDTAAIPAIMGVVFHTGGIRGFFHARGDDFLDKMLPLDQVWGGRASDLRDRLLEAGTAEQKFRVLEEILLREMRRAGEERATLHPAVQHALAELRRSRPMPSVLGLASEAGLSRRRFSQLFSEQVGASPKLYSRLHRFLGIARRIAAGGPVNWADLALAAGYSDQAHLIHDFQDFAGLSPGRYQAAERPHRYHVRTA